MSKRTYRRSKVRHDRHTVSMLSDHMVFTPKYRGKVLVGEVAVECKSVIQSVCADMEIEVMNLAVSPDHVHLFIAYPPKYSLSFVANKIKGISSKVLRAKFPHLKQWCKKGLWAPSCFHGSVGHGHEVVDKYIELQK